MQPPEFRSSTLETLVGEDNQSCICDPTKRSFHKECKDACNHVETVELDRDVLMEIFLRLPLHCMPSVVATCKHFHNIVNQEVFWKRRFFQDFAEDSTLDPTTAMVPYTNDAKNSAPDVVVYNLKTIFHDDNSNHSNNNINNSSSSNNSGVRALLTENAHTNDPMVDDEEEKEDVLEWRGRYKEEMFQWDLESANPSMRAVKKTVFKVPYKSWDKFHSQMRTKRGFKGNSIFIFKIRADVVAGSGGYGMGIVDATAPVQTNPLKTYLGSLPNCLNYAYYNNGFIAGASNGSSYDKGDVIGFKLDRIRGEMQFFKNDIPQGTCIKDARFADPKLPLFPTVNFAYENYTMTVLQMKRMPEA